MIDSWEVTIDSLRPIYYVANLFALVPPYNTSNRNKLLKHKFYSVFIALLVLSSYSYTLDLKGIYKENLTTSIFYRILYTIVTIGALSTILIAGFWNVESYKLFIERFYEVNKNFEGKHKSSKKCNWPILELFVVHFIFVPLIIIDAFVTIPTQDYYRYGKFLVKQIENYFSAVMVLLIYNYCNLLKQRFKALNVRFNKNMSIVFSEPNANRQGRNIVAKITSTRKVYIQLTDLVKLFNTIFGWPILFIYVDVALVLLEIINEEITNSWGSDIGLIIILWFIINAVMGIVVAAACDMTTKEARNTATLCFNLLLDVPSTSNKDHDRVLQEELILLARQATDQYPRFSAAGFFTVDHSVLLALLGTVTTYVIVLTQINQ